MLEEGYPADFGREQFPFLDKNARLAACFPKSTLAMAGMGTSPGAGPGAVGGLVGIWDPAPNVHEWQLVS